MDLRLRLIKAAWLATLTIVLAGGGCTPEEPSDSTTPTTSSGDVVDDELIVTITPGADDEDLDELFSTEGVTVRDRLDELSAVLLGVDPDQRDQVSENLDDSPLIDGVVDNHIYDEDDLPNDPSYRSQWHLPAIEAPGAWETTNGSSRIKVAVLDTGVDTNHEDLKAQLLSGGNTYDGSSGWEDVVGHGTGVAGVIAAAGENDKGVASVAWGCPIIPIRVTGTGNTSSSWAMAAGIALAVDEGAKVINVSYSPTHSDEILLRQAETARLAGSLVIFSGGNSGEKVASGGSDAALWVGAVDENAELADFATFGAHIDLVAPGVDIYTTQIDNDYGSSTGASFAAPIVSGVAALVWSANPDLRPATVQGVLLSTATDLGAAGDDGYYGAGLVNARAAVELAQAIEESEDNTPPTVEINSPVNAAIVSGAFVITARVDHDDDLADVTISVDGSAVATDTISPYAFVVDTREYSSAQHTLVVTATDIYGNMGTDQITVEFTDAADRTKPAVSIVSPTGENSVRGIITVLADTTDDRMVARAEIKVDGATIGSVNIGRDEARIAYNWDIAASGTSAGIHTLTVKVFDTSENSSSSSVEVTVTN